MKNVKLNMLRGCTGSAAFVGDTPCQTRQRHDNDTATTRSRHGNGCFRFRTLTLLILFLTLGMGQMWANYAYLDLSGFTDWYNDGAGFTVSISNDHCEKTEIPGTGVWRFDIGDESGTAYFKRRAADACNGKWNEYAGTVSSSQNVASISGWNAGSMRTTFVINYIHGTNKVYFDNSVSKFSNNIYFVIGHDYSPTGSSNTYTKAYKMSQVSNTDLWYVSVTDEWPDATYYAVIASTSSSISETAWGSSSLSSKGGKGYTAAYKTVYNMEGGNFLITTAASGNGKAMTITYYSGYSSLPKVNATQSAKKRDTGTSYSIVSSGAWPATIKLNGTYMSGDGASTRTEITSTSTSDASSKKVYEAVKTGLITHTYTSLSSDYYFEGWGTGTTPSKTGSSYEYNITSATTVYSFYSKLYALTFLPKGTYGTSTVTASVADYTDIVSGDKAPTGHSITVTASPATGYKLIDSQAWFSDAACSSSLSNGTNTTYTIPSLNATRGVYAKFEPITYTLSYDLDGGSVESANPTSYNIESSAITLNNPTKTGYTFAGWTGTDLVSATTTVTIAAGSTGNRSYTATWTANTYSVHFNANGGSGTIDDQDFTYDETQELTANAFYKIGYAFAGWATSAGGDVAYANGAEVSNLTSTNNGTFDLYAVWVADDKTFKEGETSSWTTDASWAGGAAPTNDYSAVTINGEVTLSSYVHVGSVTIGESGKLIIAPTGTLEVAGTISNTVASRLEINSDKFHQGALIYDISKTAPHATVNLTTANTGSGFQFIASPIGSVSVNPTFAGSGVYSYTWIEGKGWEHRGYYEDFSGDEVIVLSGNMSSCTFEGQLNPTTGGTLTCRSGEGYNSNAEGVNMIPNTLTAPIKIKELEFSGSYDNGVHIRTSSGWVSYAPASSAAADAVIPALQGYAVLASGGGSVSFDYDDAVRRASSHNDALRAPKHTKADNPDYITISVTTNEQKRDLLLSEHQQFSNGIDKGWETIYMDADGRFGELYAQAEKPMSILATDNLEGTVLGFVPGQAETYTISFEGDGKGYYLNDVKMEEATLIAEGNTYDFTPDESDNSARFVISKTPIHKVPTSIDAVSDGSKARKQLINGSLYVIREGKIYNVEGMLVK